MQPTNALAPPPPSPLPRYLMVRPLSYLIVRKQTGVITLFYLFPMPTHILKGFCTKDFSCQLK